MYTRRSGFISSNACVSRSACADHLCAKMGACEHAHKWTARALSAARTCYAHVAQVNQLIPLTEPVRQTLDAI